MSEWNIHVNTSMMERDIKNMRQSISKIYQCMEILEVSRMEMENYWEGRAKETYFQLIREEWEQLEGKRKEMERWVERMEQISYLYVECEKQVMDEVMALR